MDPLDWGALRENCAGDEHLVNEVLALFRVEVGGLVAGVRTAIESGDAGNLRRAAHRLKGALVSLGARPATERARALELCDDLAVAPELYAQLEAEMSRLSSAISLPVAA